jgi:hypothetical protein
MARLKGKLTGSIEGEANNIPYLDKGVVVTRSGEVFRNGKPLKPATIKNRLCVRVNFLGKERV